MMRSRTFKHGGLYLRGTVPGIPECIDNAYLPNYALVVLKETELAEEPELLVSEGQLVLEGQVLARGNQRGSLSVHAPVPALIRKIIEVPMPEGFESRALLLHLQGQFSQHAHNSAAKHWNLLNRTELLYVLRDCGVACTESGLSAQQVLSQAPDQGTLVVNALENCIYPFHESLILQSYAEQIIDGCMMAMRAGLLKKVVIALPEEKNRLESSLKALCQERQLDSIIECFKSKYPQQYPRQIIRAMHETKTGSSCLFLSPSTLYAIHNAVAYKRPHIEQFVSLGGAALKTHQLLKTRIGTPIGTLIEECGGFINKPDALVINNPLTHGKITNLDTPISRTTRAVWALTRQQTRNDHAQNCIRCGRCSMVCPEQLEPNRMHLLSTQGLEAEVQDQLDRCSVCGACSYVCAARLPLSAHFKSRKPKGHSYEHHV